VGSLSLEESKARGAELENNSVSSPNKIHSNSSNLNVEVSDDSQLKRDSELRKQKQIEEYFKDEDAEDKIDIDNYMFEVEKEKAEIDSGHEQELNQNDSSSTENDEVARGTPIIPDSLMTDDFQPKKDKPR